MRAVQITALNQLKVSDVPVPVPAAGEVLVSLRAAALNHRDVWIKQGQYAGVTYPCIPGSDGAGVIVAAGGGTDSALVGREVVINPSFAWGLDERAQGPEFSILGLPKPGTLAEQIAVPANQLAMKPSHLSWEESAALPLAGLTAFRALFTRANLRAGERVLVAGIGGGVAHFALQFAVAHGAKVWVTSSVSEKIAHAVTLGAEAGFNYTKPSWTAAASEAGPFDVVVDGSGGEGFEKLMDLTASGGRLVFYGATRGNPPVLPMRKLFWRQISLLGTTMGSPADWDAMLTFVARHQLHPVISNLFRLEEASAAFELMEQGRQCGKIVVNL